MIKQDRHLYTFGAFRFDPGERLLLKDGHPVSLTPRGFEALNILVSNCGRLVTKQELMAAIWGETCVEPGNLAVTISALRKALGEGSTEARFVQTVSKLGYRFVADVAEIKDDTLPEKVPAPVRWRNPWFGIAAALLLMATVFVSAKARSVSQVRSFSDRKARELYLYGRFFWNRRTEEALHRSIQYYKDAIAADPRFAEAYAGLADSYTSLSSRDLGRTTHPLARTAALRALELNPSLPDAHASFGYVLLIQDRDWNGAEVEFRKAIALDPNCAIAHQRYGLALAAVGRFEESLVQLRRAAQAEPLSLIINTDVGWGLYLSRRYDEAISAYRKVLDLDPNFSPAHTFLGLAYIQKGAFDDAVRELEESRRIARDSGYASGFLGYAQARAGNTSAGRRTLTQLTDLTQQQRVPPFSLAVLCVGLGQNDQAMEWLEKAYQARNTIAVYAKTDPSLDPLRSDLRFNQLLQRMGF